MGNTDQNPRKKWNQRHSKAEGLGRPANVLTENLHLLPVQGDALDLACGRGINALQMIEAGLIVQAWDISSVAVERLTAEAQAKGLIIQALVRDVTQQPPEPASFDVILVSHFLDRSIAPALIDALRPGGLLLYQTFIRNAVSDSGPSNPDMRLGDNELLELFRPLRLRIYREEGKLGDITQGWRDLAMLVAEKV